MINNTIISQNIPAKKSLMKFRAMIVHDSFHRLWARLTHQQFRLLDLNETMKGHPTEASHFAGLKTVSIDHIRGTLGKGDEFDAEFNPTQERSRTRWVGIALEKLQGHDLPPVDLVQIGNVYYVRDGHYRISVSRALGQKYIEAEVIIMKLREQKLIQSVFMGTI